MWFLFSNVGLINCSHFLNIYHGHFFLTCSSINRASGKKRCSGFNLGKNPWKPSLFHPVCRYFIHDVIISYIHNEGLLWFWPIMPVICIMFWLCGSSCVFTLWINSTCVQSCVSVWSTCHLGIPGATFPARRHGQGRCWQGKKGFGCMIVVGQSQWLSHNCRKFLTKTIVSAVSQQSRGCVSGNVCTFLVVGNKLLVGKTIRLKTSGDIQHMKNVMPTPTKRLMGHNLENCGALWLIIDHLLACMTTWEQFLQSKSRI